MSLDDLRPGMRLGVGMHNREGHMLLGPGVSLTPQYIARLRDLRCSALWVDDEDTRDITYEQILTDTTRMAASIEIQNAVSSLLGSPHGWPDVCNLDQAGGFPMIEPGCVEQRRYPRHQVSWPVVLETDDRISFVETIDIGMRGAKLCFRKPLALGSVVNLHIHPEDRAEMHVQAVAWRSDPDGMAFFFIGLAEPLLSEASLPASNSLELALAG